MEYLQKIGNLFLVVLLITIILASCSTTRYSLSVFNNNSNYPVGVDSLIVTQSDSIIKHLFVDFADKQKAAKLAVQAQQALRQADSFWQQLKEMRKDSTEPELMSDDADSAVNSSVESSDLNDKITRNLAIAEKKYLQAIKLDPFPMNIKDGLARTYQLWAKVEKEEFYFERALSIFKDMIKYEQGEHILFFNIGECYFHLDKWDKALDNYRQAEQVLLATTFYEDSVLLETPSNDSLKQDLHFNYLYSQAVCLARMYKANEALSVIKTANQIAPTPERKKIAERFEDWLNWDNGNIHAAEERNVILELIKNKKYKEAVSRFEKLKNQLTDPLAIDEIEWRIAGLEFNYLNKKQDACNRLLSIIKKNKKAFYDNAQLKTIYDKYVNDCGIMHYHLGMDYIQDTDYKKAQKFMAQGAKLDWYGRYKCQLELARLTRHDPKTSLEIIDEVLLDRDNLTDNEKLAALEIKLIALRKLGPQFLNETKRVYLQIRELQNK